MAITWVKFLTFWLILKRKIDSLEIRNSMYHHHHVFTNPICWPFANFKVLSLCFLWIQFDLSNLGKTFKKKIKVISYHWIRNFCYSWSTEKCCRTNIRGRNLFNEVGFSHLMNMQYYEIAETWMVFCFYQLNS